MRNSGFKVTLALGREGECNKDLIQPNWMGSSVVGCPACSMDVPGSITSLVEFSIYTWWM